DDPHDALVLPEGVGPLGALAGLPAGARVGTDSLRRAAQLMHLRPDLRIMPIRGNVDTRLRKLDGGGYDALVLAAAGLRRLGLASRISLRVALEDCIPAPGQGIIAIETREDDGATRAAVVGINDADAMYALEAERALVIAL